MLGGLPQNPPGPGGLGVGPGGPGGPTDAPMKKTLVYVCPLHLFTCSLRPPWFRSRTTSWFINQGMMGQCQCWEKLRNIENYWSALINIVINSIYFLLPLIDTDRHWALIHTLSSVMTSGQYKERMSPFFIFRWPLTMLFSGWTLLSVCQDDVSCKIDVECLRTWPLSPHQECIWPLVCWICSGQYSR